MKWLNEFKKKNNESISFYNEMDVQLSAQFFDKLSIDLNRFVFYSDSFYINKEIGKFLTGTLLFVDIMYPVKIGITYVEDNNYIFWWEELPIFEINSDVKNRQQLHIFSKTIKIEILYPVLPNIDLFLIGKTILDKNKITEDVSQFMESWNLENNSLGSIHNIYLEEITDPYSMEFKIDFGSTSIECLNNFIELLEKHSVTQIIVDTK